MKREKYRIVTEDRGQDRRMYHAERKTFLFFWTRWFNGSTYACSHKSDVEKFLKRYKG